MLLQEFRFSRSSSGHDKRAYIAHFSIAIKYAGSIPTIKTIARVGILYERDFAVYGDIPHRYSRTYDCTGNCAAGGVDLYCTSGLHTQFEWEARGKGRCDINAFRDIYICAGVIGSSITPSDEEIAFNRNGSHREAAAAITHFLGCRAGNAAVFSCMVSQRVLTGERVFIDRYTTGT